MSGRKLIVLLAVVGLASSIVADGVTSQTYRGAATVRRVMVDATVKTQLTLYHEAMPSEPDQPVVFPMVLTLRWPSSTPKLVVVDALLDLGSYRVVIDAGKRRGQARRQFFDVQHQFSAVAKWHQKKRRLRFEIVAEESDGGRASSASQSRPPHCEPEGTLCQALTVQTAALEGIDVKLTFDPTMRTFSGKLMLTELSGLYFARTQTVVRLDVVGELELAE